VQPDPQAGLQSYATRHMTTPPDKGPVVLIYGCSECNWIYRALTLEEASQISLIAQLNFEKHDCSEYAAGS
jgi:hypothetical protein